MTARRISLGIAIAAATAALLLSVGFLLLGGDGGRGGGASIGGPFELVSQEGETVTAADFRGRYMLVYFGYTYCPDVCPTELQAMSEAVDLLGEAGTQVQPIFITIDPARDTVPVLADYAGYFHPRLVALTGTQEQIAAAAKAYRVYYAKAPGDGGADYLMDHSSYIFLMGPEGEYLDHFGPGASPKEMAAEIRELL